MLYVLTAFKQDTAAAHGEPLGEKEIRLVKSSYGWPEDEKFLVPDGIYEQFAARTGREAQLRGRNGTAFSISTRPHTRTLAAEVDQIERRDLPTGWDRGLPGFPADATGIAGRDASGKVLNVLAQNIPWLLGGSAAVLVAIEMSERNASINDSFDLGAKLCLITEIPIFLVSMPFHNMY